MLKPYAGTVAPLNGLLSIMKSSNHAGWSEQEICARAATELRFGLAAYLGTGLPRRICDNISVNQEVTFYFGASSLGFTEAIDETAFVPQAIPINGNRIDVVFLAVIEDAGQRERSGLLTPRSNRSECAGHLSLPRAVVLIPNVVKASESGVLRRLSRYTLDTPARQSVRVICPLGVFDTTLAGLSVIELAHGVRVEDVRSLLRIRPQYSASSSISNIATFPQC